MLEQLEEAWQRASAAALLAGGLGMEFANHARPITKAVYTPGSIIIIEK